MTTLNRRHFLRNLGLSAAALPFVTGLPGLSAAVGQRKQRLIIMFSPNGTLPKDFWPDNMGTDFDLKPILKPLERHRNDMLILKGVANQVRGDGDNHMRGMSCLLTGTELLPGNIQGGSHTPAGWANGISIDQELRNHLESREQTRTRFGSMEFGVAVPNRADPWTRMCYSGPNQPLAPVDDPYQMFERMYGRMRDRESVSSVLDGLSEDLHKIASLLGSEDRSLLDQHMTLVREMEQEIRRQEAESEANPVHPEPDLDPNIELVNDNTPDISRMQIDLMVNALANDMTRIATLQFTRSVGQARMRWLGVEEGHHTLSHEPDHNQDAWDKLNRINTWFAGELDYLVQKLKDTPEPGAEGCMLDHTMVLWVNELGKGNNHTLNDIPFVLIGGGGGFPMGRAIDFRGVPHNRLWLTLAHAMGHGIDNFGSERFCQGGPLDLG